MQPQCFPGQIIFFLITGVTSLLTRSLYDMHEINAHMGDGVCLSNRPSVGMFQLENRSADVHKTWYQSNVIENNTNFVIFNIL
jgi:hypothetical protein